MNATAGGIPRVVMAGVPAMTKQEVYLGMVDRGKNRHWSRGRCWCGAAHQDEAGGLVLIPPPWDETRRGEAAR